MAEREVLVLYTDTPGVGEGQPAAAQGTDIHKMGTSLSVTGNITVTGTVDGRDVAADGAVLDTAVQPGDNVSDLVNDAGYVTSSGIANVVDDTTPQLGGSLDVNGQKIVSVANGNIDIEPNGTGNVLLGNFTFDADATVGAGQDNYVLTYDNATGLIGLEAAGGGGAFTADATTAITPSTPIVLDEATGNEFALSINYTTNKSTSGNDTGLLINQTDTASPGSSWLLDLQANGSTKWAFANNGYLYLGGKSTNAYIAESAGSVLISADASNDYVALRVAGASRFGVSSAGSITDDGYPIGFGANIITFNTGWYQDAVGSIGQRNSTALQTYNLYSTYTNASNYERVALKGDGTIAHQAAGTGTVSAINTNSVAFTVATLPTGAAGMTARVTDGDAGLAWGATVINSGAGATPYLVWFNGTNWTVMGK